MKGIELTSNKINDRGFTLIEVLIAMFIFATGIFAVAQMQLRALHADRNAFSQTEATMWASNQAENLIGLPFGDPNLLDIGAFTVAAPADPDNKYNINWMVTDNPDPLNPLGPPESKTIQIQVQWIEKNVPKTLTFEYIKGRPII